MDYKRHEQIEETAQAMVRNLPRIEAAEQEDLTTLFAKHILEPVKGGKFGKVLSPNHKAWVFKNPMYVERDNIIHIGFIKKLDLKLGWSINRKHDYIASNMRLKSLVKIRTKGGYVYVEVESTHPNVSTGSNTVQFIMSSHFFDRYAERQLGNKYLPRKQVMMDYYVNGAPDTVSILTDKDTLSCKVPFKNGMGIGNHIAGLIMIITFITKEMYREDDHILDKVVFDRFSVDDVKESFNNVDDMFTVEEEEEA